VKIHRTSGILPFNRKNISLCRKCCKRYGFSDVHDFEIYKDVKHKVENRIGEFNSMYGRNAIKNRNKGKQL
jgi:hypothetical protein